MFETAKKGGEAQRLPALCMDKTPKQGRKITRQRGWLQLPRCRLATRLPGFVFAG